MSVLVCIGSTMSFGVLSFVARHAFGTDLLQLLTHKLGELGATAFRVFLVPIFMILMGLVMVALGIKNPSQPRD
ncbi:MAG: hypothetical protein OEY99_02935 [Aigarchaeota archaeon]|nr:hypothetical protein [Aigarchaeota archaeon]